MSTRGSGDRGARSAGGRRLRLRCPALERDRCSVLCGIAQTLRTPVLLRVLQGIGGGGRPWCSGAPAPLPVAGTVADVVAAHGRNPALTAQAPREPSRWRPRPTRCARGTRFSISTGSRTNRTWSCSERGPAALRSSGGSRSTPDVDVTFPLDTEATSERGSGSPAWSPLALAPRP